MTQHAPLLTLVSLLWAAAHLWPAAARDALTAARTAALAAGVPCPEHEHAAIIPDHGTLRTLAGVARPELRAYPDLAAAVEALVGEVEMNAWTAPRAFAPTPADRAFLAYLGALRARGSVYVLYLQACGERASHEARRLFRAALAADPDLCAMRAAWIDAMATAWRREAA